MPSFRNLVGGILTKIHKRFKGLGGQPDQKNEENILKDLIKESAKRPVNIQEPDYLEEILNEYFNDLIILFT